MRHATTSRPRGYTMMVVLVLGLVLASLSAILLFAAERDRSEGRVQQRSVAAVYAAEAGVAVGIEAVRSALEETLTPDLVSIETSARASAQAAVPGVVFDTFSLRYFERSTNTTTTTPPTATTLNTIESGPNKGLKAQQIPVQVLAVARFDNAVASIADAVRLDLIPVFQFAVFYDGDLESLQPAAMSIVGRAHTNGDLYLSNGASRVDFVGKVTVAGTIHSHSAADASKKVGSGASATRFCGTTACPTGALTDIANNLPRSLANQTSYLTTTYGSGDANMLGDKSTGVLPLSVPLRLTHATTCTGNAACGTGASCVKVRVTDAAGVCVDDVVSRPATCNTGATASFAQSLAAELIKRPAAAYRGDGTLGAPYNDGSAPSGPYTADFGPRPALVDTGDDGVREIDDLFEVEVPRSVPVLAVGTGDDDPGTLTDRMWWKADIRIVDGIWYKKGSSTPVFDPETVNYATTTPSPSDLNHKFARVLRYTWWWDARETRVYCEGSAGPCVPTADGKQLQRGEQIRATDFDVAAFMALLDDANARALLFPGGTIPTDGVIVYVSETFDPRFVDDHSKLDRVANVRNFLHVPYLHNHLTAATIQGRARVAPARSTSSTAARTPYELGWYPENIWGIHAPTANLRSLTVPLVGATTTAATTNADLIAAYAAPTNVATAGAVDCQDASSLTAAPVPASRPASFATPATKAPCIQTGATPLGPENAVRLVRAQSVPQNGFTFVTDNRLYVLGDVNVRQNGGGSAAGTSAQQDIAGKVALIADSVTILSAKFDDRDRQDGRLQAFWRAPSDTNLASFTSRTPRIVPWSAADTLGNAPDLCALGETTALPTRINASIITGDVPACLNAGDLRGNKSGGVNNLPRYAEDWSGVDQLILGSLVSLFRAEQGNARFLGSGFGSSSTTFLAARADDIYAAEPCVFEAPSRRWAFDAALATDITSLPPGTPRVVGMDRIRWIRR